VLLLGPFAVATILLAVGGMAKVLSPASGVRALRTLRVPLGPWMVRGLALVEAGVAVTALVTGKPVLCGLVAASYIAFALFVGVAMRRQQLASCGCFGSVESRPTVIHLVINLILGLTTAWIAVRPIGTLGRALRGQPLGAVPFWFFVILACWFALLALTELPALSTEAGSLPAATSRPGVGVGS
jgi:hypothetical protein